MTFTGTYMPDWQIGTKELKGCHGAAVTNASPNLAFENGSWKTKGTAVEYRPQDCTSDFPPI
jgi:hypothetical protein